MHITRLELENIKSHADSKFEFARGTTAITGENGAGKTTLIEAIAWTLFDVLDYKKEDFVRRGAKKGWARISFESSLDEREYTVYRDTGSGYYVYDPGLKMRIADKREEVCRFLWQHLGVEAGTDLDSLFRRAIGVPQGTFTAVFLETAAERKRAFDKLLKVEEYRRGAEELLKTSRYIDQQISAVSVRIARAEGELERFDAVVEEQKRCAAEIGKLTASIAELDAEGDEKARVVSSFDEKERLVRAAQAEADRIRTESAQAALVLEHRRAELNLARAAVERVDRVKADAEKHAAVLGRIREIERERASREALASELSKIEAAIASIRADQKNVRERLDNVLNAHKAAEVLKPLAAAQEQLEKVLDDLRHRVANARAAERAIVSLDEKLNRLRESYRANQVQLAEALAKVNGSGDLAELEKRDADIVRELARLQASLERDERFQREIKNGLCPILSQKCLNLGEGETLEAFVTSQFAELRSKISALQNEYTQVVTALKTSREAEKFSAQLKAYRERATEIGDEGNRLKEERTKLEEENRDLSDLERQLAVAEAELKALDNPRAKIQFLEVEGRREFEVRDALSDIESNLERLESDRQITIQKLEFYRDLDEVFKEACAVRDATENAHRTYIANESIAASASEKENEFETAKSQTDTLAVLLKEAEEAADSAMRVYDAERHLAERASLLDLQKRQVETRANLNSVRTREAQLKEELDRMAETRRALTQEFLEKERLEKVYEATTFIRETLKEAAPLVARNYVYHVSLEANQTFREISGNAERSLKWGEDYGIVLEEGGYERPFASLSGGEQMAAALAVRLALLRQLTDIRIAFFDEPTTNMDAERRENLAIQMSQIKHFDQLFVISHDDTFEGYVDNVVSVERTSSES